MFVDFFYMLKEQGIPVSPTGFLSLQEALAKGLITSLDDLYTLARAVMIKSEKYFDMYDRVFAHYFKGIELKGPLQEEIDKAIRAMLEQWLSSPKAMADFLGIDENTSGSASRNKQRDMTVVTGG